MFFNGKQYLVGIDRFDEIVADFPTEGFIHDMLFFALGNHNDGDLRKGGLDLREGFKTAESRHVLIKKNDVDGTGMFL